MAEKERPLSPKQQRFVEEFLLDLNATQAAIRAGYSERTAEQLGHQLLKKTSVIKAIEAAQAMRSERTEITADMVLERYWALATADPAELTQLQRRCCRHCYGKSHLYQWRDQAEFAEALETAERGRKEDDKDAAPLPKDEGGFGYNGKLSPHALCPRCDGEGITEVVLTDTRSLSAGAKLLFAGVKQTNTGIEIKFNDQLGALNSVARHLGMFAKDKIVAVRIEDLSDEDIDKEIAALAAVTAGEQRDADARGEG